MFWNAFTGSVIGTTTAGIAFWLTRKHHLLDEPEERRTSVASDASSAGVS